MPQELRASCCSRGGRFFAGGIFAPILLSVFVCCALCQCSCLRPLFALPVLRSAQTLRCFASSRCLQGGRATPRRGGAPPVSTCQGRRLHTINLHLRLIKYPPIGVSQSVQMTLQTLFHYDYDVVSKSQILRVVHDRRVHCVVTPCRFTQYLAAPCRAVPSHRRASQIESSRAKLGRLQSRRRRMRRGARCAHR